MDSGVAAVPGQKRILLVDDVESLVEIIEEFLLKLGYKVTLAVSSVVAISTFLESPASFDLVIKDETMPGMRGLELAEKIFTVSSDVPVVRCTGNDVAVTYTAGDLAGDIKVVRKPVSLPELARITHVTVEKRI